MCVHVCAPVVIISIYPCKCACVHAHLHVCMCVCMCVHLCVYVCVHVCIVQGKPGNENHQS